MKCSTAALSVATLSLAMLVPAFGQSSHQNWQKAHVPASQEAARMVRARATLSHSLDADHIRPGYQFHARLSDNVRLDNGTQLHRGDLLVGKVVTDHMNVAGKSRLAIRFTQAVLKDGQTVPIKATIVGFYTPGELVHDEYTQYGQLPNRWSDQTLRIDELGVVHDVDLHSRVASRNSGVFVSKRDDFKIPSGSEIALAIAPRGNAGPANATNHGSMNRRSMNPGS